MRLRLADEVVGLTRDLIRLDTTNSLGVLPRQRDPRRPAPGRLPRRRRHRVRAGGPRGAPGQPGRPDPGHRARAPRAWRSWVTPTSCRSTPATGPTRRSRASSTTTGYLYGRGALDMKGEVAARAVALKELARSGFRPRGRPVVPRRRRRGGRDGRRRHALAARAPARHPARPERQRGRRRPVRAHRRPRADRVGVGEKGTYPARVTALGEAGHGSTPTIGDNAVPHLGEVLARVGRGLPTPVGAPTRGRDARGAARRLVRRRRRPRLRACRRGARCTPSSSTSCPHWPGRRWRRRWWAAPTSAT